MKTINVSIDGFNYELENRIPEHKETWVYICKHTGVKDLGVKNNLDNSWFENLHDKDCYYTIVSTDNPDIKLTRRQA